MPSKRLALASILLAASVALVGCSATQAVTVGDAGKSTKSAKPVEAGAKRVLTTAEATAALPTAAEVGDGWVDGKLESGDDSGDASSSNLTYSPPNCAFSTANGKLSDVALVPSSAKPVADATGDFHLPPASDDTFGLDQHGATIEIQSYKDDVDSGGLKKIADRLKTCATFTATDSSTGISSNFQIIPVSLPNYGDGTLAFRMQASVSFLIVLIDSVTIVAGHNLVTISQTGIGKIDTDLSGRVAQAVMAKLDK